MRRQTQEEVEGQKFRGEKERQFVANVVEAEVLKVEERVEEVRKEVLVWLNLKQS